MMKKITWILLVSVLMTACGESKKEDKEDKESSEKKPEKAEVNSKNDGDEVEKSIEKDFKELQDLAKGYDDETMNLIYQKSVALHRNYEGDKNVAKALFQSSSILNNYAIGDISKPDGKVKRGVSIKALDLVNLLIDQYPDFENMMHVYSLKAGILHGNLRMKEEALQVYQYLLETYPEDSMNVSICEERIANIDKDPYAFLKNL